MVVYDLTEVSAANNFYEIFKAINALSGYAYAISFIAAFWFILFLSLKNYDMKSAFLTTNYIMTAITVLFFFLGLVPQLLLTIFVVLTVASIFIQVFLD